MTDTGSGSAPSRLPHIDLSGVAPLRRAETRRRVGAIRAYLQIPEPTDADRAAAAASIGLGVQQFMSIVRAWTIHGEATAIAKAGVNAGAPRAVRHRGLPAATRAAAEDALRALPRSASHREAIQAVQAACRRRRTRPPSDSMVSYLRMRLRRSRGSSNGMTGLLIGRATAALPIQTKGDLALPEIALAVDQASGTIVAAAIVDGETRRPPASFVTAVRKAAAEINGSITVGSDDDSIGELLSDHRAVSRFTAGRLLAKAIGRGIGGVRLAFGPLASTDPSRAIRAKADQPLDPEEAALVLHAGVAAHNALLAAGPNEHNGHAPR
jgi:hypothetical protein